MPIERRFFAAAIFALCLWLPWAALPTIITWLGHEWKFDSVGQWGDSFGALSSLFTALGFAGVFAAFFMQKEQVDLQKLQNGLTEKQHRLERFDMLYFELIKLLRDVRKDVRYRFSEDYKRLVGVPSRDMQYDDRAFRYAWREVGYFFGVEEGIPSRDRIVEIYHEAIHNRFESGFAPYFRIVYTILERIRADEALEERDRIFYANLLRTQLSSYELSVIGLNALSPVSRNFRHLLNEFHMLKYLPADTERRTILEHYHDAEAFADRND